MTASIHDLRPGQTPAEVAEAETRLETAVAVLKAATADVVDKAREAVEDADSAAAEAMSAYERIQGDSEEAKETMGFLMVETATRVHDLGKHPGTFNLCHETSCMVWGDLFREQGWRA